MRTILTLLSVVALLAPGKCFSWQRGTTVSISVAGDTSMSYNVSVNGRAWLTGEHVSVHCNNRWYSSADGSLVFGSSRAYSNWDPKLGSFDALDVAWTSVDRAIALTTRFKAFAPTASGPQTIEFQQVDHACVWI
jgi:hypothetical protein